MINATICFLRDGDLTLLLDRIPGKGDLHHGFYVPPGGKTKEGERGIDCILREFEEETGLTLIEPRLRAIVTFYNKDRVLGDKKDPEDWLVEVYEAKEYTGELKGESPKARPMWINESDFKDKEMHEGDRRLIKFLYDEEKEGVFEVLVKYNGTRVERFESVRVA